METWFIYSILSGIFTGLYSFFLRVSAKLNHSSSLVTSYSMYLCGLLSLLVFLFKSDFSNITPFWIIVITSIGNAVFYYITVHSRIDSLRYIDSTIFFPIYKTISPVFMLFVSYLFFSDTLSTKEMLGFIFGILSPIILINKIENKRQINLKKGLFLLLIGSLFSVLSSSMPKIITENSLNLDLFLFISFITGGTLGLISHKLFIKKSKKYSNKKIIKVGFFNGIMLFFSVYFFSYSTVGNLAIVYTVNSLSFLIPIILSVIIYKEHIDLRKILAIIFTIISLYFMG